MVRPTARVELNPPGSPWGGAGGGFLLERVVAERESAREGTVLTRESSSAQLGPFPRRAATREQLMNDLVLFVEILHLWAFIVN